MRARGASPRQNSDQRCCVPPTRQRKATLLQTWGQGLFSGRWRPLRALAGAWRARRTFAPPAPFWTLQATSTRHYCTWRHRCGFSRPACQISDAPLDGPQKNPLAAGLGKAVFCGLFNWGHGPKSHYFFSTLLLRWRAPVAVSCRCQEGGYRRFRQSAPLFAFPECARSFPHTP